MKKIQVIGRYIQTQLSIQKEENEHQTYNEIKEGAVFKGFNLWILGFAMIIACIGLSTDSISAIIGAMLISPLMGPIIGFAFAMAIGDIPLKTKSIINWGLMTFISLLAATLFFLINPFDNSTAMLESFKKASIYDIFIAIIGGMAGFIGIIKKEGVKIMAGVAVATACMPPLCTAAYGLAHGDFKFFIGGFLFLPNQLFVYWLVHIFIDQIFWVYAQRKTKKQPPFNHYILGYFFNCYDVARHLYCLYQMERSTA